MKRLRCDIEFFKWFSCSGQLDDHAESLSVLVNKWYTKAQTIESSIPPLEQISIPYNGEIIIASPFKRKISNPFALITNADINKVIEQNNYTNQVLHVVSCHLQDSNSGIVSKQPSSSKEPILIERNLVFKIPKFDKSKFPKLDDKLDLTKDLLKKISGQLAKTHISDKKNYVASTSKDTTQEGVKVLSKDSNELNKLSSKSYRFPYRKNYTSRPFFPDVQFKEDRFTVSSSYSGQEITE